MAKVPGLASYYMNLSQGTEAGIRAGLTAIGVLLRNQVVADIGKAGTGRTYYRKGHGAHTASAPGDPPAPDSGSYRNTFTFAVKPMPGRGEVSVYTPDKRGPWLEFGTRKIAPRPHLRPATEKIKDKIPAILVAAIEARQRTAAASRREIELPTLHVGR